MFRNHPKGLYALALANTGERFGYYTMLAIFVLFLQAKFGFSGEQAGGIYGGFLAAVYFMPLLGGIIADKIGFGKVILTGIIIMFFGYLLLAFPIPFVSNTDAYASPAFWAMIGALALISIGTGLFKGNLQVLVGNLYDAPEYRAKRDNAFSLFYMAINLGAMYAPFAATKVTNYFLAKGSGFSYNAKIPALANQLLNGTITPDGKASLTDLATAQGSTTDLTTFASGYIDQLSGAYNYGFGVACLSLILSIAIYIAFKGTYKHADYNSKQLAAKNVAEGKTAEAELSPKETKERIWALILVFFVVIFFWMSFHQNGLTMTFFARDYTSGDAEGLTRIGFDIVNLTLLVVAVFSAFSIFQSESSKGKTISSVVLLAAVAGISANYLNTAAKLDIEPQLFQQFNPFFVIVLTPVFMGMFAWLANKGKEPSTPRKIGFGMIIAAGAFCILAFASRALQSPDALGGGVSDMLVSPNWLISTYLVLTFAELFLSPMGMSFVTKVAPPKYKGMMMGGWFTATAIGNYLTSFVAKIWGGKEVNISALGIHFQWELWMTWVVLIVICLLSATFIFAIMKRLEKVAK
ncbi:MFS transporter [Bacteroidia bacterium]|nr:MFS transporter [Bacteroidia bacterium]